MTAAPGVVSELLEVGAVGDERAGRRAIEAPLDLVRKADLGDLYAESGQTLQGSSSAVSKPNFASSLISIYLNLFYFLNHLFFVSI